MVTGVCDPGWVERTQESCYKFITSYNQKASWARAEASCVSMQSHLASIDSYQELIWMKGYRTRSNALMSGSWIGGYKKDGKWVWTGGNDKPMTVTDWGYGEPSGRSGENCVELYSFEDGRDARDKWYKYNDLYCGVTRSYICEKSFK